MQERLTAPWPKLSTAGALANPTSCLDAEEFRWKRRDPEIPYFAYRPNSRRPICPGSGEARPGNVDITISGFDHTARDGTDAGKTVQRGGCNVARPDAGESIFTRMAGKRRRMPRR